MTKWTTAAFFLLAALASAQTPDPPRYAISGTVVYDRDGKAASGVAVTIADSTRENAATTTTGEDGRFHFDGLKAGKYTLSAQKHGYPPQLFEEHRGFSTAIVVGPDLTTDAIVFRLHPDASIIGQVTDDHGDPVERAEVRLFSVPSGELTAVMITDDRGWYRFPHQQPGQYVIAVTGTPWYSDYSARKDGDDPSPLDMVYPLTFYGGAATPDSAARISVAWGQSATANVVLTAVRSVHIKVRMPKVVMVVADGPLDSGGVSVRRRIFDQEMPQGFPTMHDGVMEISGLAPGHYVLDMREKGAASRWDIDANGSTEIDPLEGGRPLAMVTGTVELDGAPVKGGMFVRLHAPGTPGWMIAPVVEGGTFEFGEKLTPGKYEVDFQGGDNLYLVSPGMIEIGTESVELNLKAARGRGQIDGVAMVDGHPRGGALIVLVPEGREEMRYTRDQSDSDGTFTVANIAPGNYALFATLDWEIDWKDPDTLKRFLPQASRVKVEAGGSYKIEVKVQ